jgi:3-hydroxyacyl-CoA dehydrogenase
MIEAIVDDLATKEEVFRRADEELPRAILATNTSSIPIVARRRDGPPDRDRHALLQPRAGARSSR